MKFAKVTLHDKNGNILNEGSAKVLTSLADTAYNDGLNKGLSIGCGVAGTSCILGCIAVKIWKRYKSNKELNNDNSKN